jgi:plastocyanin
MVGIISDASAEKIGVLIPEGTSVRGCELSDECYIPFGVKIEVGDEVVWTNEDMAFHTVTSGNPTDGADGLFDSDMFKINEKFSHKFEESGNFEYFCTLHPWMQGVVVVPVPLPENGSENGGGCLIATATFESELAPQVQQLRELRDNQLLKTESGSVFMTLFNDFYYSFSPVIADYERKNPIFKEAVKVSLTPLLSSLSILNHVNMDSEESVLGYGISLILLNVGMYVGIPAIAVVGIRKKL